MQRTKGPLTNNINFALNVISVMRKLIPILAVLLPLLAKSQGGLVRVEMDAALKSDIYQVVPCENRGLLVFFETKDFAGEDSKSWYFTFYNQDLEPVWNANIPVVLGADYENYDLNDSLLHLFFLNTDKVKPGSENFQFIVMDLANGISTSVSGILPSESNLKKMIIHDQTAFISLNLKNDQAVICFVNLSNASVTSYNILYPDQNFIEDICLDTARHQLLSLISNYLEKRQNKLYVQALDYSGQFVYDIQVRTGLRGNTSMQVNYICCRTVTS